MSSKEHEIMLEALEAGKRIEEEGIEFYTSAAKEIGDKVGRQNLEFLAREEGRHLKLISRILDRFNDEKIEDLVEEHERQSPDIFPEKVERGQRVEVGEVDRRIIGQAKEVEKRSIEFYENYAKELESERYLPVFEALIGEEKDHLRWLEFIEEGVSVHGYWLGLERTFGLEG